MKRINCILIFLLLLLGGGLYAQTDSIISVSGEVGGFDSSLDFLNETGGTSQYPRLTDAGELLYYAPIVGTDSVPLASVGSSTATVYGNILFNGWCESVLEQGFEISTTSNFSSATTFQVVPVNPYADCDLPCSENAFSYSFTGLTPSTTYYVRAYATNSEGTGYGNTILFVTNHDGMPCSGTPTLTDKDGNVYNTVQIGSQCWMKENLRTTKYAEGTSLMQGSTTSDYIAYWYYPNNNSSNKTSYGLLYNWKAIMRNAPSSSSNPSGVQGICPNGWHIPSEAEWTQLTDYVSSKNEFFCDDNMSYIAKALSTTTGWNSSSYPCWVGTNSIDNNTTGFSALPAGNCLGSTLYYTNFGDACFFWSSTEDNNDNEYVQHRTIRYTEATVLISHCKKNVGISVRCVRDEYETAIDGEPCGTCMDYDGNSYSTIKLGNQCWMKENLRTTHYANGTSISTTYNAMYDYRYYNHVNNDNSNDVTYGLLYSWQGAMGSAPASTSNPSGVQGACPNGWHLPSIAEWDELFDYVGNQSQYQCNGESTNIGKALASTTGWSSSNINCAVGNVPISNNSTGFDIRPAGTNNNVIFYFGEYALHWTSDSSSYGYCLHNSYAGIGGYSGLLTRSVRCVKD